MVDIVLADDHEVVRRGLRSLLEAESDFRVVGEVDNGLEVLSLVEKLHPDILVLDLMMPGINGLEVIRLINQKQIEIGIVILTMHNGLAYVSESLRCGAKAYVLKESPYEELLQAIREVLAGHYFISPLLSADWSNENAPEERSRLHIPPHKGFSSSS